MFVELAGDALPEDDSGAERSEVDAAEAGDPESEPGDAPDRTDGDAGIVEVEGLDAFAGEATFP